MTYTCRIFGWLSYSHWGMFRLPLLTAPDWFAFATDTDDEDIEAIT